MRGLVTRAARLPALVLVLLLLLPVASHAHSHTGAADATRSCPACLVVHHAPAVSGTAACVVRPLFAAVAVVAAPLLPLARHDRPMDAGRAPPLPAVG
ncbi:MAG TPA: hypothetical protein VFD84_20650 [Candidatus Binatia bacterium]|nr:hypothetical protein [Candidatus Binatia bacterium]